MNVDREEVLEILLDHYQNPRNYGEMSASDIALQGGNPGCGDIITVYLKFKGDQLEKITYTGQGCTISQAAASLLTEMLPGKTLAQIDALDFHTIEDLLGEELVKMRPKCSTLGLDTIRTAAKQYLQHKRLEE